MNRNFHSKEVEAPVRRDGCPAYLVTDTDQWVTFIAVIRLHPENDLVAEFEDGCLMAPAMPSDAKAVSMFVRQKHFGFHA